MRADEIGRRELTGCDQPNELGGRAREQPRVCYQSTLTPKRMIVGPMMLTGWRNADPLLQVMF